jgi:general secretion pathway protein C
MGKLGMMLRQNAVSKMPEWPQLFWRLLGVLVIGGLLANWTWVLFAPRSASVSQAVPLTSDSHTERLFGVEAISLTASSVTVLTSMPNVRLVGVFAGHPGFAVLELDGKHQLSVATGSEIAPGSRLVEVAIDHVVIERAGVRQQVVLEGKATAIKSATAATLLAVPAQVPVVAPGAALVSPASVVIDPATLQHILNSKGGL